MSDMHEQFYKRPIIEQVSSDCQKYCNCLIVIATIGDWLKSLMPIFQPMGSKTKTNGTLNVQFFPCFKQVTGTVFTRV